MFDRISLAKEGIYIPTKNGEGGLMRNKGGFTLIELVIVIIILGVLAAVAIPTYLTTIEKARGTQALNQLAEIKLNQDGRAITTGAYANGIGALGYAPLVGVVWDPGVSALFNYRILTGAPFNANQPGIVATRKEGTYMGRTIRMQLGAIAANNQPGEATWTAAATAHPAQP